MTSGNHMTSPTVPEAFPQLTAALLQRLEPHGHRRKLAPGEVVGEPGQPVTKIFVVVSGQLDAFTQKTIGVSKDLAISFTPGMFTGERSVLAGGRFLGRIAAVLPSEVLEIDRDELLQVMATDTELSDIFLLAFILRRLQLIDRQQGDVVILGSNHCSGLLHILEFLTRNGHPYKMVDLDTDAASQELLDRFHLTPADIPVVICRGSLVLKNPTVEKLADCLGLNPTLDRAQIWDVVIVGAGPAGLGAAVYAASEGLNVVVVEANAPGGQAGTSSKIENYLGFPLGISGQELAARAYDQAQKFGARVLIAKHAIRLNCDRKPYRVLLGAGEAAVFLAETAQRVHMLIRSGGLSSTMSRYLISRIDAHPRIVQHPRTEIVALEGNGHLERVAWRSGRDGPVETQNVRHVFTMTGAEPSTKWLRGCLALDEKGFVKTGPALTPDDLVHWPLRRQPYLLETSLPGVLAVGDVRSGSTKRVASAVGEGSIAVASVHQILAE